VTKYNCGGFDSYYGPCGAHDCVNCYPASRFPVDDASDNEEDAPEPIGWRCVAPEWEPADSGNLWHTPMAFIRHMHRVHGKAPSLYPMNGDDRYCYEERRYILRAVYEEAELPDEDDLLDGDQDDVDLAPAHRDFLSEARGSDDGWEDEETDEVTVAVG
jgi:hypothetical protein